MKQKASSEFFVPEITSAGQLTFWNRQVDAYKNAHLTNDNDDELTVVRTICSLLDLETGNDVITLGGAVGSRDPGVVVDVLIERNLAPKKIVFNDLSPELVRKADSGPLAAYREKSVETETFFGPIVDVAKKIANRPRAVLMGLYGAHALVADEDGSDGLSNYIDGKDLVGDFLAFQWCSIKDGLHIEDEEIHILAPLDDSRKLRSSLRTLIHAKQNDAGAIRVIGWHTNNDGFFLSHWFTKAGIEELLRSSFNLKQVSINTHDCRKGWVVELTSHKQRPEGVITVLNNVIGNVLPQDQLQTLKAISRIALL